MNATTLNASQITAGSVVGMASAVFTSLCAALVTTAVRSNTLVDKSFNVLIHGVSAAEHIAEAGEGRAQIYGKGIVSNGILAERESELKQKLRLYALEAQEVQAQNATQAVKPKPTTTRRTGANPKKK